MMARHDRKRFSLCPPWLAVELARAASDQTLSDEILEVTREVLKQDVRRNTQAKDRDRDSGKKK